MPEGRIPGLTVFVQGKNVEFLCVCNSWRGADGEGASVSSKRSLEMFLICMRSLLFGFHRILELGSECIIGKLL